METNTNSILLFPEKILINILTRLPAKTLHRFKCISKHYLSLITSPRFLTAYLTLSPQPPSWILTHRLARVLPSRGGPPELSYSVTEPPNISYLTLVDMPRVLTDLVPPIIVTSSNGLILFTTLAHHLSVVNPVTADRALLPGPHCGKIAEFDRVALAVKYNQTFDDVSLVVIELQAPNNPSEEAATLLMFRSDTEKWEKRAARYEAGSERGPHLWEADTCFEVGGRLFWVKLSCGMLVLDDPFGERMELRFIPLPEGHVLPHDTPVPLMSRGIYPVGDFVHYYPMEGKGRTVWRLTDVEKGEWSVVFTAPIVKPCGLPEGLGEITLAAFHALEAEVVVLMGDDKTMLFNLKENQVLEIGTCLIRVEDGNDRPYLSILLPSWPTPIPKRLEAYSLKDKGNHYFRTKDFRIASVFYTRSINIFPTAAAFANRAAALIQQGKYRNAENDCTKALKLDEQYVKVYVRRATCRKELGKLLEAKEDVEMALKLDGSQHRELLKLSSEINCLLEKEAVKGEEDGGL